jgi:hypothetical protein
MGNKKQNISLPFPQYILLLCWRKWSKTTRLNTDNGQPEAKYFASINTLLLCCMVKGAKQLPCKDQWRLMVNFATPATVKWPNHFWNEKSGHGNSKIRFVVLIPFFYGQWQGSVVSNFTVTKSYSHKMLSIIINIHRFSSIFIDLISTKCFRFLSIYILNSRHVSACSS